MSAQARIADPLVTVITAHAGNPLLARCIESVRDQHYGHVQHLVVADGPTHWAGARAIVDAVPGHLVDLLLLPYATGRDGWNGHRIYGAGTFLAQGEYILFLDDDNALAPEHIQRCLDTCRRGHTWAYSLRNIVDGAHRFVCRDDCESLGKWPSVLRDDDHLIDVNCYFLPKALAVRVAPTWHTRFRAPGVPDVDRSLCHALAQLAPDFECTYAYSVDYLAGSTAQSVQPEFFLAGNAKMLRRHGGRLPWALERPAG